MKYWYSNDNEILNIKEPSSIESIDNLIADYNQEEIQDDNLFGIPLVSLIEGDNSK